MVEKNIEENLKDVVKAEYNLVEVPTQTQVYVKDSDENLLDTNAMLCKILNELSEIRKIVG